MAIFSESYCLSLLNENYHLINPFKLKGKMLWSSRDTKFCDVDDDKIWMSIHLVERDWNKIVDFTANEYFKKFSKVNMNAMQIQNINGAFNNHYKSPKDIKDDLEYQRACYKEYKTEKIHPCGQIGIKFILKSQPKIYINTMTLVDYDKNKNLQLKMSNS